MPRTRTAAKARATSATEMLEKDHREVERLFERLEKAKGPDARLRAFAEVKAALTLHAQLEEGIFYPAVRTAHDEKVQEDVSEALAEHLDVKSLLADIEGTDPSRDAFAVKCLLLIDEVSHHVEEEEREMFPRARSLLGEERLRSLGDRMGNARAKA
jgi:hemerythrin superfamily protein